jgi:hypothetical protein
LRPGQQAPELRLVLHDVRKSPTLLNSGMTLPINDALTVSAPRSANPIIPPAEFVESLSTRAGGSNIPMVQSLPGRDPAVSTVLPKAEVNLAHSAADPRDRDLDGLRQKRKFENPFKLIWLSSLHAKICACADGQISGFSSRVPRSQEGRIAIVTNVGRGMRWTRALSI